MKQLVIGVVCLIGLTACSRTPNSATAPIDNTAVNERDRDSTPKTPIDQNENQSDVDLVAEIHQKIVDTEMSANAQNVTGGGASATVFITTGDGMVTLQGSVKTVDEKSRIVAIATEVAGKGKVDDQLEVEAE